MTPETKRLLELIENVDPADTRTLDEIDARVVCYLSKWLYTGGEYKSHGTYYFNSVLNGSVEETPLYPSWKYTRSRDVLKSIRPAGWVTAIEGRGAVWFSSLNKRSFYTTEYGLDTEELAELHAIIQAISHERGE